MWLIYFNKKIVQIIYKNFYLCSFEFEMHTHLFEKYEHSKDTVYCVVSDVLKTNKLIFFQNKYDILSIYLSI